MHYGRAMPELRDLDSELPVGRPMTTVEASDALSTAMDKLLEAIGPVMARCPLRERPTDAVHAALQAQIAYERARR